MSPKNTSDLADNVTMPSDVGSHSQSFGNVVAMGVRVGKKILVAIALTEVARGIFILLTATMFTAFVDGAQDLLPMIFVALSARILIENIRSRQFYSAARRVRDEVRRRLHASIFNPDARPISHGELLTLTFDAVSSLETFIERVLPTIVSLLIMTPLILIVAAFIDPISTAIFFATLPIAPFLLYLIGRAIGERNERAQAILVELNSDFDELLRAIPTLKMFRRTTPAIDRLKTISERSTAAILDVLRLAFVSAFALELITTLAIALVAVTCGLRLTAGSIDFRAAFLILMLAPEFFAPIRQLGAAFHSFIDAKQSVERLRPWLDDVRSTVGNKTPTRMPPSITLDNVSLRVLRDVNFSIEAGKITVITGESGRGKTTLLRLIAGLERPTAGEIFINELPLSKMERRSLAEKIAYVPQQPHYFNASFLDNATCFKPVDRTLLERLSTELGLDGGDHKLSRGQLQRLGMLRAVLKLARCGSSIMILDEPTAGLDCETERTVVDAIKKYSRRRTIVIAAHRPAVVELADRIIDLDSLPAVVHAVDGNVGDERDRIGVVGE